MCNYLVGVRHLVVEVNVKYIKGMLANPDIQPNTTINRWIAGILLFNFMLVHIPVIRHTVVDGLSRWPPALSNLINTDDHKEWIDNVNGFMQWLDNIPLSIMAYNTWSWHMIPPPDNTSTWPDNKPNNDELPIWQDMPELPNKSPMSEIPYTPRMASSMLNSSSS